jgi:uncharacterized protein YqgC (DUF456 family)
LVPAWGELLVALACAVGILGVVVPVLPGDLLIGGAIVLWAVVEGSAVSWVVAVVAVGVLVVGHVLTVLIPGKRMTAAGVPKVVLLAGGALGIVGFFVVPVVGLPIGFVLGVYLAETVRLREHERAWATTVEAMKGTGLAVLIGLCAAVLATAVWAAAAITT